MSTTGERIRELRHQNKLTLDDVAAHLGIGKQAVYKYEQGAVTNIPLENLEKMAELFGTTPGYLAGWTDDPPFQKDLPNSNDEIRILIPGSSKLSPEQHKRLENAFRAVFLASFPELSEGDDDK